jgi:S1-C subfamily serine protease
MMLLAVLASCAMQDPIDAVVASEARRVAVIDRCAQAVCSVMSMDSPGGGSGVIIDPAGFLLTNYHVVGQPDKDYKLPEPPEPPAEVLEEWRSKTPGGSDEEAAFVAKWKERWQREHQPSGKAHYKNKKIGLPDGRLYEGVVLGIDPGSDLAVVRLLPKEEGQTWPYCELGDSDAVLVGETVFAMGNPFLLATDFTPTVTFGIVSGTHRYQEGQGNRMLVYPDCIQVDAPVNPGNSGGPLFNEQGQVIGINGRISIGDRGRVNVGVGFAIASNQINNFLGDLVSGRHAEHGTLDMSAWFMTSREGKEHRRGVFVQQMFKDSVTAAAGIGLGDEITQFNGIEVRSANQLATMVGVLPAGAWVTLRHRPALESGGFGDEREVTVKLTMLDTGSSRDGTGDDARLGSRIDRRIAKDQIVARWPSGEDGGDGGDEVAVQWTRRGPDGTRIRAVAFGDQLRLEIGDDVYVRTGPDSGFARVDGETRDLTAGERERLRRELVGNPLLWPRAAVAERLEDALLLGGVHVHGKAGYRFELPGDGECEAWFLLDGTPAGFVFRDPLRRKRVAHYVLGHKLRVVADGELETGWSAGKRASGAPEASWFERGNE